MSNREQSRPDSSAQASKQSGSHDAKAHSSVGLGTAARSRTARKFLMAIPWVGVVPLVFFLRYGEVGALGWGLTVFLIAICVLGAAGLHFQHRTDLHTPVAPKGNWLDLVGAFWLVACAFGPLVGWLCTALTAPTVDNWRWFYGARVFFAVILPLITMLPCLRYVRGKGTPLMLAILTGVTALPVWSAWWTMRDFLSGPAGLHLVHTSVMLQRP